LGAGALLVIGGAVYFAGNLLKSEKQPGGTDLDLRCAQICDEAEQLEMKAEDAESRPSDEEMRQRLEELKREMQADVSAQ